MELFRWGDFEELLTTSLPSENDIEISRDFSGIQFGRVSLSEAVGDGVIEYFHGDAMRVLVFDCRFNDDQTFHVLDDGWIRLNFSLDLTIDMSFGPNMNVHETQPSGRFLRMPPEEPVVEKIPARHRMQWVTVCCRPDALANIAGLHPDDLPFRLTGETCQGDAVIYRPYKLNALLKTATTEVIHHKLRGKLRSSYVAAKANELIVLALDHLLHEQSAETLQVRLTERDIEAMHEARRLIGENLADAPSIQALSLKIGINRNKLYYGFKSLFGMTITEYLQNCRIEHGWRLLSESEDSIADIAAKVGFRHQCNFSTAFKARYGISPRAARLQTSRLS